MKKAFFTRKEKAYTLTEILVVIAEYMSHLGISRVPCKSSLNYMNGHRSYELFKDFYFQLLDQPFLMANQKDITTQLSLFDG